MGVMDNRGFTLVEILITLSILSILAGLTIPKINNEKLELKTEARQLCNEIRFLRVTNMTENQGLKIILYRNQYIVEDGSEIILRKDLDGIAIFDNLDDNYGDETVLHFNNNGTPDDAGTISIQNIETREYLKITINPVTGRVLLYNEIFTP